MDKSQTYSITLDDVQSYLDSKADDEVIGVTCGAQNCLVTNAFRFKYPHVSSIDVSLGTLFVDGKVYDLGGDMHYLYRQFDMMHSLDSYDVPVTKSQWTAKYGSLRGLTEQASTPESEVRP